MRTSLFIFAILLYSSFSLGQISGQSAASLLLKPGNEAPTVVIHKAVSYTLSDTSSPLPKRAGYLIPIDREVLKTGRWAQTESGIFVWRLALNIEQAEGLNLYIQDFQLREGETFFIYNRDRSVTEGPFTLTENGSFFVSDFIAGQEIVLELNTNIPDKALPFGQIEVGVSVNKPSTARDFGDSQFCEVPVNCAEGDDWQNEKQGVGRILVKSGSNLWWCTGTLINNTNADQTPYFLTANHCGQSASETDYAAWKFYFDFESDNCEKPTQQPESIELVGSKLKAKAPDNTSSGSDFKLLLITDEFPAGFRPWFNGWDRSGTASQEGVCIHHPEGDIKMISTYEQPIVSTTYNNPTPNENGIYWKVIWGETDNGFGVTEPGSSGSPLFNPSGEIIGSLTGGQASCSFPLQPDYYGKLSYSWESNGSDSSSQLKYWLDPNQTGVLSLNGSNFNPSEFFADFSTDTRNIKLAETVLFSNNSYGNISQYKWTFPGGEPSSYTGENPPPIRYSTAGTFDVSLEISNAEETDKKLRKAYIQVSPTIYPNPSSGKLTITTGKESGNPEDIQLYVFDVLGREVQYSATLNEDQSAILIDLQTENIGMYFIRLVNNGNEQLLKVMISK